MRVLLFNFRAKPKNKRFRKPPSFERILFMSFLAVFVILLGVQAALLNPAIRSSITLQDGIQGVPLGAEEYLYNEGTMEIQLLNEESRPALKILVNGEERASFDSKSVEISVIDGDVVEVDGSEILDGIEIAVSSVSTNMQSDCIGKKFLIEGNVQKIVKVKITSK
jgi:hypothetical protein